MPILLSVRFPGRSPYPPCVFLGNGLFTVSTFSVMGIGLDPISGLSTTVER